MEKLTILVDADGVLENLTDVMLERINEKYGTSVTINDIKEWDLTKAFPTLNREQVYGTELDKVLYERIQADPQAQKYLKLLHDEGHEIFVVTATPYQVLNDKMPMLFGMYPFLDWNHVILTGRKQLVRGDVLIDDGIHNLEGGTYRKLLFSAPYNEYYDAEANGMTRVRNWEEAYREIQALAAGCE